MKHLPQAVAAFVLVNVYGYTIGRLSAFRVLNVRKSVESMAYRIQRSTLPLEVTRSAATPRMASFDFGWHSEYSRPA